MKKLLSFMLLLAAVLTTTVFASCGDDDNNDEKVTVAGTYTGTDNLSFTFNTTAITTSAKDVQYVVKENSDGSINVTLPQETYDFSSDPMFGKMIGVIVQGSHTIKNIPYDSTKKAYYLDYSNKVQANVSISGMSMNKEFYVTKGIITVTFSGSTVTVENEHKFGSMPMELYATFTGVK